MQTNWHVLTNDGVFEYQAGLVVGKHEWVTTDGQTNFVNLHCKSNLALTTCPMRVLPVLPPLPLSSRFSGQTIPKLP